MFRRLYRGKTKKYLKTIDEFVKQWYNVYELKRELERKDHTEATLTNTLADIEVVQFPNTIRLASRGVGGSYVLGWIKFRPSL